MFATARVLWTISQQSKPQLPVYDAAGTDSAAGGGAAADHDAGPDGRAAEGDGRLRAGPPGAERRQPGRHRAGEDGNPAVVAQSTVAHTLAIATAESISYLKPARRACIIPHLC